MIARVINIALLFLALSLLAACDAPPATSTEGIAHTVTPTLHPTSTSPPGPTPTSTSLPAPTSTPAAVPTPLPEPEYLTAEIPPCTPIEGSSVDPCDPDANVEAATSRGMASEGSLLPGQEPLTVRDHLHGTGVRFVPSIVLRGAYIPDTVRCTTGNLNRAPSYAEPGYFRNALTTNCYADVRVNGYILGSGPPRLTVLVFFETYFEGFITRVARDLGITAKEFEERIIAVNKRIIESGYRQSGGIYGMGEVILFIGAPHSHSVGAWEVFDTWGVQRGEDDTVVVFHPERDYLRIYSPADYQAHRFALAACPRNTVGE